MNWKFKVEHEAMGGGGSIYFNMVKLVNQEDEALVEKSDKRIRNVSFVLPRENCDINFQHLCDV